jgi:uncharacterized protein (DUF1697 family)
MTTFICLLRGINVGGKRVVKMESLRALFESAGAQNVRTYIQSGNVIFEWPGASLHTGLEEEISQKIEAAFGFSVPLLLLKSTDLKRLLAANPYGQNPLLNSGFFHLTLFKKPLSDLQLQAYEQNRLPAEEAVLHPECAYLYCPAGYQNFKGSNSFWEQRSGTQATTRNWKTLQQLVAMSGVE